MNYNLNSIPGKGDLFGPDLDYTESVIKSRCDVKSLTYCDLQCILLKGLRNVLEMYPEFAEKFAADLLHDLTYNLRDGCADLEDEDEDRWSKKEDQEHEEDGEDEEDEGRNFTTEHLKNPLLRNGSNPFHSAAAASSDAGTFTSAAEPNHVSDPRDDAFNKKGNIRHSNFIQLFILISSLLHKNLQCKLQYARLILTIICGRKRLKGKKL